MYLHNSIEQWSTSLILTTTHSSLTSSQECAEERDYKSRGDSEDEKLTVEAKQASSSVNSALVGKGHTGCISRGVLAIHIGSSIRRFTCWVSAVDADRLYESIEMAGSLVFRIVPVNHSSSPLDGSRGRGIDTSRPDAMILLVRITKNREGSCTLT